MIVRAPAQDHLSARVGSVAIALFRNAKCLNSCLCFQLKLALCLCVLRLFISQHNCSRVFVFQGPASNVCLPWKDLLRTPGISMQHCCHWPTLAGFFTGLRTNSWILSVAPAIKLPFPSSAVCCRVLNSTETQLFPNN